MYNRDANQQQINYNTYDIYQAVFIVNRHAKTALEPAELYSLKKQTLSKLIHEGMAKKVGLHFSNNPRVSKQQSDVLVKCEDFFFHIPPTKEDFQQLPHLGFLENSHRNPKVIMSLSYAKKIIYHYLGISEKSFKVQKSTINKKNTNKSLYNSYFNSKSTFTFPSDPIRKK
ncbi:hypothetical protein J5Y03_05910 [Bacillus sp. RG28]|uniref:YkyB-like protein n=1 Tax=Gottfriedia endophytica TaxID=2820819 RepID=A0A940NTS8_9BACI|nr:YkyB family protein [Gottfriedia endophytica]MBP0724723.1 hypothetical protein [Gottfriedia endophytica]